MFNITTTTAGRNLLITYELKGAADEMHLAASYPDLFNALNELYELIKHLSATEKMFVPLRDAADVILIKNELEEFFVIENE